MFSSVSGNSRCSICFIREACAGWGGDNLAVTFGLLPIVAAAEWEGRRSWREPRPNVVQRAINRQQLVSRIDVIKYFTIISYTNVLRSCSLMHAHTPPLHPFLLGQASPLQYIQCYGRVWVECCANRRGYLPVFRGFVMGEGWFGKVS